MSALSVIERRLGKWNQFASLLPKPIESLPPIDYLNKLLKACAVSSNNNLRIGESIHAHLIIRNQSSLPEDVWQINSLINFYGKCGETVHARKLFDSMPERNVVSWSSMMSSYKHSNDLEVLRLFKSMVFSGDSQPNEFVATVVFGSCSSSMRIQEGKQCHCFFLKSGLVSFEFVRNALVYMYSSCCSGTGHEAIRLLDDLPCYDDLLALNSALSGFLERGALEEGVAVLRFMAKKDLVWDDFTFMSSLRLCSNLRDLELARQIHSRMLRTGYGIDVVVSGALVNMYGKCGQVLYAQRVYDGTDKHDQNIVSSTSIMDAYFQNKSFEEALNLFAKLDTKQIPPNEFTFAVLLNSVAELSLLKHGDLLHGRVVKSGFRNHLMVGNALVNMYAKSGSIEDARKAFSTMSFRNVITWNSMICGFSHHGLGREALEAFEQMMIAGEFPNRITFIGVLHACSHIGFVEQGLYYFNQLMKQFGVQPDLQHYTCIVGLLSKAGLFEEAESFMRSAPIEWDVIAWRALINACYVRRNYSLGKRVAEYAIEMYPNDSGIYILLSNIHGKSKEWEGVARVRSLMKTRLVKKEPGVSWIGIRNQTHVFLAEENQHPEILLIYAKVKEVLSKIRALGYSPDVAGVSHDVDEEQGEVNLSYHSEKLAVAYGLMKTPENSPLYVTKNVRICDDCHTAIKLISKLTNRLIIIRDSNRFHHFRDGQCSCCDYW